MARRKRTMQAAPSVTSSPETMYARRKAAQWMQAVLDKGIAMESSFFECLNWVGCDLGVLLSAVHQESAKLRNKAGKAAHEAITMALDAPKRRLHHECEELLEEHSCLQDTFLEHISAMLDKVQASHDIPTSFAQARAELGRVFGLDAEAATLCEFVFLLQSFPRIECYFEDVLEVFRYANRHLLACLLGMPLDQLARTSRELKDFGIVESGRSSICRLSDSILSFWSAQGPDCATLFSRPLEGDSLPLSSFRIPAEDVEHVRRLLESRSPAPLHILLYGTSGTGKSTFARSLAKACGVEAWAVNSRSSDDDSDRRTSLAASLHLASKREGAFVVVDEAERLLDTDLSFGRQTKDKAWLNDFLEKPGQRIVWISNQVGHIDPAVRRRFAYSLHFPPLGVQERVELWQQVLKAEGLLRRISQPELAALARKYPVQAAVIQKAVRQSAALFRRRNEFRAGIERILQAHLALQNGGNFKPKEKVHASMTFTLKGVCMEGDAGAFLERCRRVDAALNSGQPLRPGCGTMLFYGPPGTGKTELARHIADQLGRDCLIKRASDLLSPYVGESEQNVAAAFREAEKSGAVLVIDEADSFLYSRESAQRSWESTLVNEFLTSLERCRGFCICTTNRRDQLDPAAMRRFSHKLEFRYADSAQVLALYEALLAPLCEGALPEALRRRLASMDCLAPGDFHAVRAQFDPLFTEPGETTHEMLMAALEKEAELKIEPKTRRVGFLG
ncbi:MAG: AAA family ATPase [Mailhella sp.]|nr:AAA family ATPase [Mailhella sp.]